MINLGKSPPESNYEQNYQSRAGSIAPDQNQRATRQKRAVLNLSTLEQKRDSPLLLENHRNSLNGPAMSRIGSYSPGIFQHDNPHLNQSSPSQQNTIIAKNAHITRQIQQQQQLAKKKKQRQMQQEQSNIEQ